MNKLRPIITFSAVATTLAMVAADATEPPIAPLPVGGEIEPPSIVCTGLKPAEGGGGAWVATFRVENLNKTAQVAFHGYMRHPENLPVREGAISPLYSMEMRRDGKWVGGGIGWCGTGAGEVKLVAGSKTTFSAHVKFDGDADAARIGFNWWVPGEGKRTYTMAWSSPIPSDAIAKKARE
jgi:hypothetical protein